MGALMRFIVVIVGIDHGIDNDIFYRVYTGTFNGILNEIGSCFQTGFFIGQSVYGIVDGIYNEICYIVMGFSIYPLVIKH